MLLATIKPTSSKLLIPLFDKHVDWVNDVLVQSMKVYPALIAACSQLPPEPELAIVPG